MPDVHADGGKLGWAECAARRTCETRAARQVFNEEEAFGTDDLVVSGWELTERDVFILGWD